MASYDELKSEIVFEAVKFQESAKKRIPLLVEALKNENRKIAKDDIKDRILKDFLQFWTRETIMNALGDDYKDKVKQEAGRNRAITQNITSNGSQVSNFSSNDSSRTQSVTQDQWKNPNQQQTDLVKMSKQVELLTSKLEAVERRNDDLQNQLNLKKQVETSVKGVDEEGIKEKLEAAEMEIKFLKEGKNEELIGLKGKKADMVGQFYYGRCSIKVLQQKLPQLVNSGINAVEIYMVAL